MGNDLRNGDIIMKTITADEIEEILGEPHENP